MLAPERNWATKTTGVRVYSRRGKPTDRAERVFRVRANFVFRTTHIVQPLCKEDADADLTSGYLLRVDNAAGEGVLHFATASSLVTNRIQKEILQALPGSICRISSSDIQYLIQEDLSATRKRVGRIFGTTIYGMARLDGDRVWVFVDRAVRSNGEEEGRVFFVRSASGSGAAVANPPRVAFPALPPAAARARMAAFSAASNAYFRERRVHALHVYAQALKATLMDQVMEAEHQVAVPNLSGPPNVGKSFASSIALALLGAEGLMLSRCTPSALIEVANGIRNSLVVWDDPRDATQAQLATIVHEAFHGHCNTTLCRGSRRYHSLVLIGTQSRLLNMKDSPANLATFSRLAHIDMEIDPAHGAASPLPTRGEEAALQDCLPGLSSLFFLLADARFDKAEVDRLEQRATALPASENVIQRSIRNLCTDWHLCRTLLGLGFQLSVDEVDHYFLASQLAFLQRHCSTSSPLDRFLTALAGLDARDDFSFKAFVKVRVGAESARCVALTKDCSLFADFDYDAIRFLIKESNGSVGWVNHNVAFRSGKNTCVARALLVRHTVLPR